jgi:hypothetical protein
MESTLDAIQGIPGFQHWQISLSLAGVRTENIGIYIVPETSH